MKRMRIVGLCLVAVFAMGAVVAASASAETPHLVPCVAAAKVGKTYPTGEYTGKYCENATAKAGGKYKLGTFAEAKKLTLTIKGGRGKNYGFDPETGKYVGFTTCATEKGAGEFTSTGANFKVEYSKCENAEKAVCTTENAKPKKGVVVDEELSGVLVNLPGGKIGLDIHQKASPGGTLAEYDCGGVETDAIGGVIGEVVGGTEAATKDLKFVFRPNSAGTEEGSLQQWLYPSTTVSETEGYAKTYEWFGDMSKPEPTTLFSVIDKGVYTFPSVQGAESSAKGEAFKIIG
jgi:hypothetical protein